MSLSENEEKTQNNRYLWETTLQSLIHNILKNTNQKDTKP